VSGFVPKQPILSLLTGILILSMPDIMELLPKQIGTENVLAVGLGASSTVTAWL